MWAFFVTQVFKHKTTHQIFPSIIKEFLEMIFLYCIFVMLIEKDGGIRPCEVLATCAYKVLHSTGAAFRLGKDKLVSSIKLVLNGWTPQLSLKLCM